MNKIIKKPIAFILGPTASGKTDLALEICDSVSAEIISVDSVMVYEDCNIGSAKPSKNIFPSPIFPDPAASIIAFLT